MIKFNPLPPLERLNELLEVVEIPPDKFGEWSGLVWKVNRCGTAKAGSVVGSLRYLKGRRDRVDWQVMVDGTRSYASRVIYYMTYGEDPGNVQVDHKDRNTLNNNAWNLRLDVNCEIQGVNRRVLGNNTSGVTGVTLRKGIKKWQAYVQNKSKKKHLGFFTCKVEAARVANSKWVELGWDKLGRQLNNLESIECNCESCTEQE